MGKFMAYADVNIQEVINQRRNKYERTFIKKGHLLHEEDKTIEGLYFCESGIARAYTNVKKSDKDKTGKIILVNSGEEITNRFFSANEMIIPFESLITNAPMTFSVQVIEAGWFFFISIEDWKIFAEQEPNLARDIMLKVAMETFKYAHGYKYDISHRTTEERYDWLIDQYPYTERIPDKYIASLLAVDIKTLRRNK